MSDARKEIVPVRLNDETCKNPECSVHGRHVN